MLPGASRSLRSWWQTSVSWLVRRLKQKPEDEKKKTVRISERQRSKEVCHIYIYGCFQNRGIPKWMVKIMENPIKMDDLGVFPYFWVDTHKIHIHIVYGSLSVDGGIQLKDGAAFQVAFKEMPTPSAVHREACAAQDGPLRSL